MRDQAGVINVNEAYSKSEVMERLGISQPYWGKMLKDGLPFTPVGHSRWVTGKAIMEYLERNQRFRRCQG
jgi:hypothetical protein